MLNNCSRLTDAGFAFSDENCKATAAVLDNDSSGNKIFLGSRAEAELLEDIKLTESSSKAMKKAQVSLQGIGKLRKLHRLELENVKLTEVSLKFAFKFDDLRIINLNFCKYVRDDGFKHLVDNNPFLEVLTTKQTEISGPTVAHLVRKCARLIRLDFEGCQMLTNEAVKSFPKYCNNMRALDVSFCRKVRIETIEDDLVKKMPNLQFVGVRGLALAEALEDFEDGNKKGPAPPPPPRRIF